MNAGDIIGGRYRLQRQIGEGGQASVWQARDNTLDRDVAVKFIYAADDRTREVLADAFLREAKISAAVKHRNVVQILDFGFHTGDVPFMVIELLEGETLADRFDRGVIPIEETLDMALRCLEGLAAVHDAGIVHRDLKPENVFLVRDRSGVYPKLLDFGISKVLDPTGLGSQDGSVPVEVVGTPEYMSAEQACGLGDVDHRADLYALAVVIYEAIAERVPYDEEDVGALLKLVVEGHAVPLIDLVPQVGHDISHVVMKGMHREREHRYQSANEMRDALIAAAEQTLDGFEARTGPVSQRASREFPTRPSLRPVTDGPGASFAPAAASPASDPGPGPERGRPVWLIPGAAFLALLAVGGIATSLVVSGRDQSAPPRYIVVRGSDDATAGTTAPASAGEEPPSPTPAQADAPEPDPGAAPPPTVEAEPPKPKPVKARAKPVDQVTTLTRAFTRQKSRVEHCLHKHAGSVEDQTRLSVRVALDASGAVREVSVAPAGLAESAAGACVARAVRNMRFGKQPQAVAFRVPLTARRGK